MTHRQRSVHAAVWMVAGPAGLLAVVLLVLNRSGPARDSVMPLEKPATTGAIAGEQPAAAPMMAPAAPVAKPQDPPR